MITSGVTQGASKAQMITEASIQGINDSYLVIVGIGIVGLLLSLFIKRVKQATEASSPADLKIAITKEA
ncbi:hypothetical protein D3C87_1797850 [compost metagenome]